MLGRYGLELCMLACGCRACMFLVSRRCFAAAVMHSGTGVLWFAQEHRGEEEKGSTAAPLSCCTGVCVWQMQAGRAARWPAVPGQQCGVGRQRRLNTVSRVP
ncbi:hypothetical protein COO60DRAFT_1530933 [Scenedesmus sp. NREL 46B-D3]|nr:hypothetical protein COO60DRAFT_1530933 [Scenedesmus sp. NREL 46B-D3]